MFETEKNFQLFYELIYFLKLKYKLEKYASV